MNKWTWFLSKIKTIEEAQMEQGDKSESFQFLELDNIRDDWKTKLTSIESKCKYLEE